MEKIGPVKNVLKGFTLVELLLVMGIFALIAAISSISYFSTFTSANLNAAKDVLISDIKTAQSNAMSGKGQDGQVLAGWGIKVIDNSKYILFPGPAYDENNLGNLTTTLPTDITVSTTFSSSSISFSKASGEILGFTVGADTVTLTGNSTSHVIRLNKYGAIIGE